MLRKLTQYFKPYLQEGICIAFSGGADSSLLLKTACLSLEESLQNAASQDSFQQDDRTHFQQNQKILAIIAETRLHPHEDTLQAEALARSMGAECIVLKIDEFQDNRIMYNPKTAATFVNIFSFLLLKKPPVQTDDSISLMEPIRTIPKNTVPVLQHWKN